MFDKVTIEGHPAIEFQDGGLSMTAELGGPDETPISVVLHSWSPDAKHSTLKAIVGDVANERRGVVTAGPRKLRITIEVI